MRAIKKLSLALVCVAALGAGTAMAADGVVTAAAVPLDAVQADPQVMRAPGTYITSGKIVAIEDGLYIIKGEGSRQQVAAVVDRDTYVVDGKSGKLRLPHALKVGQQVTAYYSAKMTRSLPPQSHAMAIVIGAPDEGIAAYFEVVQAAKSADGSCVTLLNANNDLIATVDAAACSDFAKIKRGDKLLLWYDVVTMSMPAQCNPGKVIILP